MKKDVRAEDNFAKTAISFVLGVVVGFSLLLMGLVFIMVAILTNNIEESEFKIIRSLSFFHFNCKNIICIFPYFKNSSI